MPASPKPPSAEEIVDRVLYTCGEYGGDRCDRFNSCEACHTEFVRSALRAHLEEAARRVDAAAAAHLSSDGLALREEVDRG